MSVSCDLDLLIPSSPSLQGGGSLKDSPPRPDYFFFLPQSLLLFSLSASCAVLYFILAT